MTEICAVELLSKGLLNQFSSLKELEVMLSQLLAKQGDLLENEMKGLDYKSSEEIVEVSLMMKKMNLYRLKIMSLRSDMRYIHQRVTELKKKSLHYQSLICDGKVEKIRRYDYEEGLIAKANK